ncbi:2'-5' RNA ligase family protein [Leisingera caerulea]|uniref:2'-5' RNA ligase family protein n=1 Tax=Leisingera caerulea TaxID=506591 RepID=A0A9Q9M4P7_LEICA|nr:2'-5' RNA ligase family protein [Leisingera caerulea]UWQ56003.1 2'-5' RNA ligase family protein [Leisingera caerulea]
MIYVLAHPIFEPEAAERIGAFRVKHEPERAKLVPPHVTLVFGVADGHLQTVSDLVDKVSCQTRAFPVFFDRCVIEFDPFEKKHKLFLLCGEGNEPITDLHNRLYNGAHSSELSSEHPFEPHMTIASYDERAEAEQIDVSALGDLPIRAQLTALDLVRLDDGCLTALKTVPLIV